MGTQSPTAAPLHFRPMPIVAKRSPISATAELLFLVGDRQDIWHVKHMLQLSSKIFCGSHSMWSDSCKEGQFKKMEINSGNNIAILQCFDTVGWASGTASGL